MVLPAKKSGNPDQILVILRTALVAQVVIAIWAAMSFKIFDSRLVALVSASIGFNLLGLANLMTGLVYHEFRKTFAFYLGILLWFSFTLPMFLMRLAHLDLPADELKFLFWNGTQFHKLSTYFYFVMMTATAGERWRKIYIARAMAQHGHLKQTN